MEVAKLSEIRFDRTQVQIMLFNLGALWEEEIWQTTRAVKYRTNNSTLSEEHITFKYTFLSEHQPAESKEEDGKLVS